MNLLIRDKYVLNRLNETKKLDKNLLPEIKRYKEFRSLYGLSQLIDCPARITCNTSSLIDHILRNTQESISQSGVFDTVTSDHSLIYCTRKTPKAKYNRYNEITFRSFKNYSPDVHKRPWREFYFLIMKNVLIMITLTLHKVILLPGLTTIKEVQIYKEVQNKVQNLIRKKKKAYFEEKLKESTAYPRKLWKTLKYIGLPEKRLLVLMSV